MNPDLAVRKQYETQADRDIILLWADVIKATGRALTEVSETILLHRTTLPKLVKAAKEGRPFSLPSIRTARLLSATTGVPLEALLSGGKTTWMDPCGPYATELEKHSSRLLTDLVQMASARLTALGMRPTMDDVIKWWYNQGGSLTGSAQIEEQCDLIKVPNVNDRTVIPFRVGTKSLASQVLGKSSEELLSKLVDTLDPDTQRQLVASYYKAAQSQQPVISRHSMKISIPEAVVDAEVEFIRLQIPVVAAKNEKFVMNFCVPADQR